MENRLFPGNIIYYMSVNVCDSELNNRRLWHAHSLVDEKPFLRIESSSCIAREVMSSGTVRFV